MEQEWLKDFFIQFLKSPKWVNPIQEFIDNQCFIFDNEEENKLAYTDCHNQFKVLIDSLLTEQLRDVITEEKLEAFCAGVDKSAETEHDAELFGLIAEQLLSVDDFIQFRAMMTKRNLEQQMEALRSLRTQNGEEGDAAESSDTDNDMWKSYEEDLQYALELSQKENTDYECFEESELQKAIALSLQEINGATSDGSSPSRVNDNNMPARSAPHGELAPVQERKPLPQSMQSLPSQVPSFPTPSAPPTAASNVQKPPEAPPRPQRQEPSEEEKRMRAEHLKRQREMLLEKKRVERQKNMEEYEKLQAATKPADTPIAQPPPEPTMKQSDLVPTQIKDQISNDPEKTATQLRQALTLQLRQSLLTSKS